MATSVISKGDPLYTWIWSAQTYSGDGISGYGYADFHIPSNIPSGRKGKWKCLAVRDIFTSDGRFIGCCLNVNSPDDKITIRLFNCTSSVSYPGTIKCDLVYVNNAFVAYSGYFT